MTDDNDQVRTPPPPRRRRPAATKRVPPPSRKAKGAAGAAGAAVAGGSNGNDQEPSLAALIAEAVTAAVAPLQAQVDRLQTRGMPMVEPHAEPKPEIAVTADMSDFTRSLVERTHEAPKDGIVPREPLYNVPERTYLKPPPSNRPNDPPTYVRLQGDGRSRSYYEAKGFVCLSEQEAEHHRTVEQPRLVQEQRAKATLINALRLLVKREATLSGYVEDAEWDDSLASMTIAHLEEEWHTLCRQTPNPERRLPRAERVREERDAEGARLLNGVETTPPRSVVDALEQQTAQARKRNRDIEVTAQNWNTFR